MAVLGSTEEESNTWAAGWKRSAAVPWRLSKPRLKDCCYALRFKVQCRIKLSTEALPLFVQLLVGDRSLSLPRFCSKALMSTFFSVTLFHSHDFSVVLILPIFKTFPVVPAIKGCFQNSPRNFSQNSERVNLLCPFTCLSQCCRNFVWNTFDWQFCRVVFSPISSSFLCLSLWSALHIFATRARYSQWPSRCLLLLSSKGFHQDGEPRGLCPVHHHHGGPLLRPAVPNADGRKSGVLAGLLEPGGKRAKVGWGGERGEHPHPAPPLSALIGCDSPGSQIEVLPIAFHERVFES